MIQTDLLPAIYGLKLAALPNLPLAIVESASTVVNNLAAGLYSFQLKVTDNAGATGFDTVNINVNNTAPVNQPPVANAGIDQTDHAANNICYYQWLCIQ